MNSCGLMKYFVVSIDGKSTTTMNTHTIAPNRYVEANSIRYAHRGFGAEKGFGKCRKFGNC